MPNAIRVMSKNDLARLPELPKMIGMGGIRKPPELPQLARSIGLGGIRVKPIVGKPNFY